MSATYVFGHRRPDTDSVCASISLSYLKNKLGLKTEPRTLGEINKETKFVLKYFNLKQPKYLNDVKFDKDLVDYLMNNAISNLKRAKANHDIIESYYFPAMDFDKVEVLKKQVIDRILKFKK